MPQAASVSSMSTASRHFSRCPTLGGRQFARFPSAPQYCGATPTDIRPSMGTDTSSITTLSDR